MRGSVSITGRRSSPRVKAEAKKVTHNRGTGCIIQNRGFLHNYKTLSSLASAVGVAATIVSSETLEEATLSCDWLRTWCASFFARFTSAASPPRRCSMSSSSTSVLMTWPRVRCDRWNVSSTAACATRRIRAARIALTRASCTLSSSNTASASTGVRMPCVMRAWMVSCWTSITESAMMFDLTDSLSLGATASRHTAAIWTCRADSSTTVTSSTVSMNVVVVVAVVSPPPNAPKNSSIFDCARPWASQNPRSA
mmetsp:Transcript_20389/g.81541  ORF Transcript_20389/g.81541 Transcript_20389/m.81541 type:complete len:253 (-) Transcript_20389:753-1511(-)